MCVAKRDRVSEVTDFLGWCDQPYIDYFDLNQGRADEIARTYFGQVRGLSDETICRALSVMREAIEEYPEAPALAEWKRCCSGVGQFLLLGRDLDGADRVAVAGALQRLSDWSHTNNPLWQPFQPWAKEIGDLVCGQGRLHFLKIGEEWCGGADRHRLVTSPGGWSYLWRFAEGVPNEVRREKKRKDETRALASRLLGFLCEHEYKIHVIQSSYDLIVSQFFSGQAGSDPAGASDPEDNPVLAWSISSPFVEMLASRMVIRPAKLVAFLEKSGFHPDRTCRPPGSKRLAWLRSWRRFTA